MCMTMCVVYMCMCVECVCGHAFNIHMHAYTHCCMCMHTCVGCAHYVCVFGEDQKRVMLPHNFCHRDPEMKGCVHLCDSNEPVKNS